MIARGLTMYCKRSTCDDRVITFESALSTAIEFMLSDEYEIKQTEQHLSYKGYPCRRYVVSINA